MLEPYQWYILYVRTNKESAVIEEIDKFIAKNEFDREFDVFCPESEYYYRKGGAAKLGSHYKKRPLFPGYVFVETTMSEKDFAREFGSFIYDSQDIVRLLRYGNTERIALPLDERRRLEFLLRGKRCFEHSVGYIVGDEIVVQSGPLKGHEGMIVYINRHNRFADIEMEIFGGKTKVRVALEIVDKK